MIQRSAVRLFSCVILLPLMGPILGCGASRGGAVTTPERIAQAPQTDIAHRLEQEPAAVLEEILQRTGRMDQYELTFYRQERLGLLIPKMASQEEIHAKFRKQPFSVTFEWPRNDSDYYWCVYVEGQNDNKQIVRERRGVLGLPPQRRVVNVSDPVTYARCKNPITDFGLEAFMTRTLMSFHDPSLRDASKIQFVGLVNLDPMNRRAYHLHIERPAAPSVHYTHQEFYIDAQTLLPAGTDLYLPDGTLDAKYRYTDVNTNVRLTDGDFQMDGRS